MQIHTHQSLVRLLNAMHLVHLLEVLQRLYLHQLPNFPNLLDMFAHCHHSCQVALVWDLLLLVLL